jgi:hypothetical protein
MLDLPPSLARGVNQVAAAAAGAGVPMAAALHGNPYAAAVLDEVPILALTYDWAPLAEQAAVRAIFGDTAIGGRLPVTLGF